MHPEDISRTPAELVQAYSPLAVSLAREWSRRRDWLADDFISDALLSLWKAAQAWDASRGIPFATFARTHIRWAIVSRYNLERAENPAAFRTVATDPFTGEEIGGIDSAPAPISDIDQVLDDKAEAAAVLEQFPAEVREIVRRRFWGEESFAEIAADLGVTPEAVRGRFGMWWERVKSKMAEA